MRGIGADRQGTRVCTDGDGASSGARAWRMPQPVGVMTDGPAPGGALRVMDGQGLSWRVTVPLDHGEREACGTRADGRRLMSMAAGSLVAVLPMSTWSVVILGRSGCNRLKQGQDHCHDAQ